MSAKRAAPHALARKPAASEAPWPPSFQPRNAVTRTGRCSSGRSAMRSSSAMPPVYAGAVAGRCRMRATSTTVHDQTAAATATWTSTSHQGRCVRYCSSPSPICTRTRPTRPTAPAAWTTSRASSRPKRATRSPPECGPAAVANVPVTTSANAAPTSTRPARRSSSGTRKVGGERPSRATRIAPPRTSIESSEGRLQRRADEDGEGERGRPEREAVDPPRREPREEGERDRRPCDHPVPELDVRVVALLREGIPRLAARPVLAAEPGAGKADRGPGRDDDVEGADGGEGEGTEARRRDLEDASTGARRGRRLDVHENESRAVRENSGGSAGRFRRTRGQRPDVLTPAPQAVPREGVRERRDSRPRP